LLFNDFFLSKLNNTTKDNMYGDVVQAQPLHEFRYVTVDTRAANQL